MNETPLLYKPSEWQQAFHNTKADEILGAGAAGPGKTQTLINDVHPQIYTEHMRCERAMDHPFPLKWNNSVGWALHLRRELPMLDNTLDRVRRILPAIDSGAKWYGSDLMWVMSSGYKFQFGHCKDPDDWERYFSQEYTHVGFDELIQFLEEQYDNIRGRVRTTDPVLRSMLRTVAMSNPLMKRLKNQHFITKNPLWVRERFIDPAPMGKKMMKKRVVRRNGDVAFLTRIYLPARLEDNPDKEFVLDYELKLLGMKPHVQRALRDGDWYATEGSFYADVWNPRKHVCRPFKIPDHWPRFRSLDWGYAHPGCIHWCAMDEDDNLYVFREQTFQGKTDVQVAKMILEIELKMGLISEGKSVLTGPADTQLWEMRGEHLGVSKAAAMAKIGVNWFKADKSPYSRQRMSGEIVKRLKGDDSGLNIRGIYVFETCTDLIRTIPTIQTDEKDIEVPADGGNDHWHDSLMYACSYASIGRVGTRKPERDQRGLPPRTMTEESRGRLGYGA